tara:strand:+ start:990 stop:1238 length:249 start_codon:yes stop_codon:yes gene_type:complete
MIIKKLISSNKFLFITTIFVFSFNSTVQAYIGLGPLIPVLGSIVVWVFVVLITIFGFIVYPVKKILDKVKNKKKEKNKLNLT